MPNALTPEDESYAKLAESKRLTILRTKLRRIPNEAPKDAVGGMNSNDYLVSRIEALEIPSTRALSSHSIEIEFERLMYTLRAPDGGEVSKSDMLDRYERVRLRELAGEAERCLIGEIKPRYPDKTSTQVDLINEDYKQLIRELRTIPSPHFYGPAPSKSDHFGTILHQRSVEDVAQFKEVMQTVIASRDNPRMIKSVLEGYRAVAADREKNPFEYGFKEVKRPDHAEGNFVTKELNEGVPAFNVDRIDHDRASVKAPLAPQGAVERAARFIGLTLAVPVDVARSLLLTVSAIGKGTAFVADALSDALAPKKARQELNVEGSFAHFIHAAGTDENFDRTVKSMTALRMKG